MKKILILFPILALLTSSCSLPSKSPNNLNNQTKNNNTQTAVTSTDQNIKNSITTDENKLNNQYSLSKYPYSESTVYKELNKICFSDDRIDLTAASDFKLLKNGTETIIPSLKKLIRNYEVNHNIISCYSSDIEIISVSKDGDYLYLNSNYGSTDGREHVAGDLASVYRLDLKNLTVNPLNFLGSLGGLYVEQNKILSDGNRLIWWDRKGVYLFDMRDETNNNLYTFSGDEWPIASANGSMVSYNIKVSEGKDSQGSILINLYNKNITEDGYPIKGDVDTFNLYVDSSSWKGDQIKPKFIKQISVSIPN